MRIFYFFAMTDNNDKDAHYNGVHKNASTTT